MRKLPAPLVASAVVAFGIATGAADGVVPSAKVCERGIDNTSKPNEVDDTPSAETEIV